MHPILLFLLAIFTPVILCLTLLLPVYAGIFGACWVVYAQPETAHPLATHLTDLFYIVEVYGKLFDYWWANKATLGFVDYALPVAGLPLAGAIAALWLTNKAVRKLLNLFHLSGNVA